MLPDGGKVWLVKCNARAWWAGLGTSGNLSGKVGGGQMGKGPECPAKQVGMYREDNREQSKVSEQGRGVVTAGPKHPQSQAKS